jgi:3-hydroxymyristoyl/3-hydroxydecanoyl-(acyl carrier protein) dehydratase
MNLNYLNNFTQDENTFSFSLSKDIPFFDGHFPNQEILPAVVYIEICLLLLNQKNIQIEEYEVSKSKFLKPLAPDSQVVVELLSEQAPYKFVWLHEGEVVAKINFKV